MLGLSMVSTPSRDALYEDTDPPPASEAMSSCRGVQSNPNGPAPDDAVCTGVADNTPCSTGKTSIVLESRSVTASKCASGSNRIAAAPWAFALSARLNAGAYLSEPSWIRKPVMLLLP